MKRFLLIIVFASMIIGLFAQRPSKSILDSEVTLQASNRSIKAILGDFSTQTGAQFSYSNDAFNSTQKVNISTNKQALSETLSKLFGNTVTFKAKGKYIILRKAKPNSASSSSHKVVEGYIFDKKSGETVADASVYNKNLMASAVTDQNGHFKIEVPASEPSPVLQVSKAGYSNIVIPPSDSLSAGSVDVDIQQNDSTMAASSLTDTSFHFKLPKWFIPQKIKANVHNLTDTIFRNTQVSVLPMVGTNRLLSGNSTNRLSFNLSVGYVQSVEVFEAGVLINIDRYDMKSCQLAGLGNIVGRNASGFQGAGYFNLAQNMNGCQLAGWINGAYEFNGAQVSGFVNICRSFTGIQCASIVNIAFRNADVQVGGLINMARTVRGCQIAGITNIAQHSKSQIAGIVSSASDSAHVQISGLFNNSEHQAHLQIAGLVNNASNADVQIAGLVNTAPVKSNVQIASIINFAKYSKFQLGLINIADTCPGVTLGLFSFVSKGYHKLEFSANEIFFTNVQFRTGSQYLHSIFSASLQPQRKTPSYWAFGYGLGSSFGNINKWLFEVDLTAHVIVTQSNELTDNIIQKIDIGFDRHLAPGLSLYFGLTLNQLSSFTTEAQYKPEVYKLAPYVMNKTTDADGVEQRSWIGGKLALRFF